VCRDLRAYVTDTVITFVTVPPDEAEMAARITAAVDGHAWLVLLDAGRIAGYACGSPYKARAAYRWSCEVSVYLELGRRRTGAGRMLYNELFTRLAERGFRNRRGYDAASVGLHRAMGFEPAGAWCGGSGVRSLRRERRYEPADTGGSRRLRRWH
jgi:L-amino acid N-acyltransferase YncA